MGILERSKRRKKRIVANRAASFADAEQWDLEFWQNQSPAQRLSALVAIRRDIQKGKRERRRNLQSRDGPSGVFEIPMRSRGKVFPIASIIDCTPLCPADPVPGSAIL